MDSAINWAVYRQSLPKDLFSIGETGEDCEKPPFDGLEKSFQQMCGRQLVLDLMVESSKVNQQKNTSARYLSFRQCKFQAIMPMGSGYGIFTFIYIHIPYMDPI